MMQDGGVLQYQNRQMQIRIKELRADLFTSVDEKKKLSEKHAILEEELSFVSRCWNQV
jgi:hypothetical protein